MTSDDTPKASRGRCDGCAKEPRKLTAIASGQMLCNWCRHEFRMDSRKKPTDRQIEYVQTLGLRCAEDIDRESVSTLLDVHENVRWFLAELWEERTGRRLIDCFVPSELLNQFVSTLIVHSPAYAARIWCSRNSDAELSHNLDFAEIVEALGGEKVGAEIMRISDSEFADALWSGVEEFFSKFVPKKGVIQRFINRLFLLSVFV